MDRGLSPVHSAQLQELPIGRIEPNPLQPRRLFADAQLEGLARSIASQGVMQPLVVRPHPGQDGRFQLVAGERRLRAVERLGWAQVPALVREVPDDALLEAALVENLQREPLTPPEEALAYRTLLDRYGYTQEALAERVGKDRSTIANMVRLLALPPLLLDDLDAGRLSVGHARALLAVPQPDHQIALRGIVLQRKLSVRETEQLVQRERRSQNSPPDGTEATRKSREDPGAEALQFQAVQEMLEQHLATRVSIAHDASGTDGGGRIQIEYYSLEDFNRLYDLLVKS